MGLPPLLINVQRLTTQKVNRKVISRDKSNIWFLASRVGVSNIVKQENFNGLWNFCTLISLFDIWVGHL